MPSADPSRKNRWFLGLALAAVAAKLWLVEAQDLTAIPEGWHDDRLLVDHAASLLSGDWLGSYHERTLIMGPFYSFWIAATFLAGVPLLFSQHLLYAAACGLLAFALLPIFRSRWAALALFTLVLFNPVSFDVAFGRAYRTGVNPALALLVVACGFALLLRLRRDTGSAWPWSLGCGLAMAALWLNREDAVWILPVLLVALAAALVVIARLPPGQRLSPLLLVLLPLAIWQTCVAGVSLVNYSKYGVFVVTETRSREFEAAWGALSRAGASEFREYVPVPKQVRSRLYQVSPAFAELRPMLDGPRGEGWAQFGCSSLGVCDDIAGGWALWAVREAAAEAGHHRTARVAAAYYERLASEVDAACDAGELDCSRSRATLAPVLKWRDAAPLARRAARAAATLVRFDDTSIASSPSWGGEEGLALFEVLTGEELAPPADRVEPVHLEGWAFSLGRELDFVVLEPEGARVESHLVFRASPGFYEALSADQEAPSQARRARFDLWTTCSNRCLVQIFAGSDLVANFRIDQDPPLVQTEEVYVQMATSPLVSARRLTSALRQAKLSILEKTLRIYRTVVPLLLAVALVLYLLEAGALLATRSFDWSWLLATALLAGIGALLVLVAWVDLSSFSAIQPKYLGPAYPLMLAFAFLMWRRGLLRLAGSWR